MMIDFAKIEELTHFDFIKAVLPQNEQGFFIQSVRMDCNYCVEGFHIQRDNTYPYFTLHAVFSGCSFFQIAGKDYLLKKGDIFLITAGQEHQYHNYEHSKLGFLWVELSGLGCKELLRYLAQYGMYCIDAAYSEHVINQMVEILSYVKDENEAGRTPDGFTLSAMQYNLMMCLLKAASAQPARQASPVVEAALAQIDAHFSEELQIQQLATQLNVSHTYLTRRFKQDVGVTPVQYLVLKRIEYACYLLEHTNLSCAEIAGETGFYDATHFLRAFRKAMGDTPLKYRNRKKKEENR